MLLVANFTFAFSAHHFPSEAFEPENNAPHQRHASELRPRPFTWLHVDYRQQGLGGIDSWGWHESPMTAYQLPYKSMRLRFALAALEPGESSINAAKHVQAYLHT